VVFLNSGEAGEKTVTSNVSYTSVTELGFRDADKKMVYGDANPDLQYGLLWLPGNRDDSTGKAPLVVLIHGGCWLNAYDIKHSKPLASALADAGYAVWSLEYRRSGDEGGGWPGSFDDIRQGLSYISNFKNEPIDAQRVVLMGHSAGGHLALLAATQAQNISAVIGLAAITDIVTYSRGRNSCQTATLDFMGGVYESDPLPYEAANPNGKPVHAKTLLLQGGADTIVPLEQSTLPGATPIVLKDAGHFDWIHPGSEAFALLLSTLQTSFQH